MLEDTAVVIGPSAKSRLIAVVAEIGLGSLSNPIGPLMWWTPINTKMDWKVWAPSC